MKDLFLTLARYHVWATRRLFEQVDTLDEADYRRDAGLFFRSVHGTLNHLLVAEHGVWFERFAHGVSPRRRLDEEVETDRARLRERLLEALSRWLPLIEALPDERWSGVLDYHSTQGVAQSLPYAATLAHVFNHATHHRGQISAALTAMGRRELVLDLVAMLQAESRP